MATCDAPGPLASKNTRSPAWIAARSTCTPALACSKLVRGSVIPAWAIAHCVSPEQSYELGPTPPSAYGKLRAGGRDRGAAAPAAGRRRGAGDPERAERLRTHDPVDLERVRRLERAHRPSRLASEHGVGADAERALDGERRGGRGHGAA